MASGLERDIRSCLRALGGLTASSNSSHGGSVGPGGSASGHVGTSAAPYPTAWLLLDLAQLLPPNHRLTDRLQGDEAHLCKELDAASRSQPKAARMAAAMLQAIGSDIYSSRQLAQLLCQNDDMLQLCLQAWGGSRQVAEALYGISRAAWQAFAQHAAALPASIGTGAACRAASAPAIRSLHIASRLTADSEGMAEWVLLQHGRTLAMFFTAAIRDAAALPEDSKAVLSECLSWWACAAPRLSANDDLLAGPCLDIAGAHCLGASVELRPLTSMALEFGCTLC